MSQQKRRRKIKFFTRAALLRLGILAIVLIALGLGSWATIVRMPGQSYVGKLPPLTAHEQVLKDELYQVVESIAGKEVGEHNYVFYKQLLAVADFLDTSLAAVGYQVNRQSYQVYGKAFDNLEVEIPGTEKPEEIVLVGAHYDSVMGAPGANDNGTGAAAVLALARHFAGKPMARTLRFVEFVNEEPPFFWTEDMGSLVYAKRCRERGENIVAMLSLETMGYYTDESGTQQYPLNFLDLVYPERGNFISFIGNLSSGELVRKAISSFRRTTQFPSQGVAMPSNIPGVGWSDHWSFWQMGYPALMVTDTAPFRYPHYHTMDDTPEQIDYERLARVVAGLERVVDSLASEKLSG